MTPRPVQVDAGLHTSDDGLYGPDSVTWRVMAAPAIGVGASAAAMIQMLLPPVMYVIDQASSFRTNPESRSKRTGDYTVTITYGDVDSAERAGEVLRNLHATRTAVDPSTGEHYRADDPDLLLWVHHSLTWALLRAVTLFGPGISPADANTFVAEQRDVAARLVGCDLDRVVTTTDDLEAYMAAMVPRLAMTTPALWFRDMVVPPRQPLSPEGAVTSLFGNASVLVMAPEHQQLYGFRFGALKRASTVAAMRLLLASGSTVDKVTQTIPLLRRYVDDNAFGGRRRRKPVAH
jgi:uncharacterized protein (DUF2236 family)